jgi:hypothetical protein
MADMLRGYEIEQIDGEWRFVDTGQPTATTWESRPCGACHRKIDEHDPCLGLLPGVMNACCGHGLEADAYIQFPDGRIVTGAAALELASRLKDSGG